MLGGLGTGYCFQSSDGLGQGWEGGQQGGPVQDHLKTTRAGQHLTKFQEEELWLSWKGPLMGRGV